MCSQRNDPSAEASPRSASGAFDRRDFLRLSGAGLLGVVLLGSGGLGKVFAQAGPSQEPSLVAEFEQAAEEYGVPVERLMAMGYVNTRWEMPPPEASAYRWGDLHGLGSYGIMALVQNPYSDTLGEASRLPRHRPGGPQDESRRKHSGRRGPARQFRRRVRIRGALGLLRRSSWKRTGSRQELHSDRRDRGRQVVRRAGLRNPADGSLQEDVLG